MRSESQHSACVYVAMRLDFTCDVRELRARTEVARGVVARSAVVRSPVRVCVDACEIHRVGDARPVEARVPRADRAFIRFLFG